MDVRICDKLIKSDTYINKADENEGLKYNFVLDKFDGLNITYDYYI